MATAETKRQSIGNKIATPKNTSAAPAPAQGPVDVESALVKAIGARVTLKTSAPNAQTYKGTIFAADRMTNIVVISTPGTASQTSDFHLVHASKILDLQVDERNATGPKSFTNAVPSIGPVDTKEAEKREAQAVALEKEKEQRQKQGVTSEGEDLFTAIERMLPIRWAGQKMVVNENVVIDPPFRPENCQAPKGNEAGLARVKKVVENVWAKSAASRSATPQPRKGG